MLYLSGLITENQFLDKPVSVKLPAKIKSQINDALHGMGNYHDGIPIQKIGEIMAPFGVVLMNEDNTPFGGFFTGREGRTSIDLALNGQPVSNSMLVMTWSKMPSNRYEIVAYLS